MKDKKHSPFDPFAAPTPLADPVSGAAAMLALGGTMMQLQVEMFGFISRRLRSQMELPRCVAACQNLPELAELQKQYVQHAAGDYAEFAQHLAEVWSSAAPNLMSSIGPGNKAPKAEIAQMTDAMSEAIKRSFSDMEAMGKGAWGGTGGNASAASSFQPWWLMASQEQSRSQSARSGRNGAGSQRASAGGNGRA